MATTPKGVRIARFIPRGEYKKAPGIFDTLGHDPPENLILFNTLARSLGVFDGVASATVQQPMKTPRSAMCEIACFYKNGIKAAHCQIA